MTPTADSDTRRVGNSLPTIDIIRRVPNLLRTIANFTIVGNIETIAPHTAQAALSTVARPHLVHVLFREVPLFVDSLKLIGSVSPSLPDGLRAAHPCALSRSTARPEHKKTPTIESGFEVVYRIRHRSVGTACHEKRHTRHSQLTCEAYSFKVKKM
jgi:hypothetical protein